MARLALDGDRPVAGVDDLLADPEPEAEARMAPHRGRSFEPLEDSLLLLERNSLAGVLDVKAGDGGVGVQLHLDGAAAPELDGVGEQVGDHLAEAEPIPVPDHLVVHTGTGAGSRRWRRIAHQIDRLDHQRLKIGLLGPKVEPSFHELRNVEQLIDELVEADHLSADGVQPATQAIVAGAPCAVGRPARRAGRRSAGSRW